MKILVNQMPLNAHECPYSEWKPNPPFIQEPGYYVCSLTHNTKQKECNLNKDECRFFIKLQQ